MEFDRSGAATVFSVGESNFCFFHIGFVLRTVRKRVDEVRDERKVFRMDAEVGPFAASFAFQKSGFADDLYVAGDRRLRHS